MSNRIIVLLLLVLAAAGGIAGCAPIFSGKALDKVDRDIPFSALKNNPERYEGKWVMLGGEIIETRNTREGTVMEVLQRPLTRQGRPVETDETGGRFMVESPEYLDPAVYRQGKPISLIGKVAGQRVQPLGEIHYRYPVLNAEEIRLWEPRRGPRFSFGISVFHQI